MEVKHECRDQTGGEKKQVGRKEDANAGWGAHGPLSSEENAVLGV